MSLRRDQELLQLRRTAGVQRRERVARSLQGEGLLGVCLTMSSGVLEGSNMFKRKTSRPDFVSRCLTRALTKPALGKLPGSPVSSRFQPQVWFSAVRRSAP